MKKINKEKGGHAATIIAKWFKPVVQAWATDAYWAPRTNALKTQVTRCSTWPQPT